MKKWECTVCGYVHEGDTPPDACPVCGAGSEYFKEIVEAKDESATAAAIESSSAATDGAGVSGSRPGKRADLILKYHLHPISVHTPNGVLPVGLVFLALAIVFGLAGFEQAAFYNMVFVLVTMPVVIITGYLEWRNRYKGVLTKIFWAKIVSATVATVALITLVGWRVIDPQVTASIHRWTYLAVALVMVAAVGLAGHMGGKLVFDTRDR